MTLEKGMAAHSSILAWRTPWTEEPGGLLSMGCRVRHDWSTNTNTWLWSTLVGWGLTWGDFYWGCQPWDVTCCHTPSPLGLLSLEPQKGALGSPGCLVFPYTLFFFFSALFLTYALDKTLTSSFLSSCDLTHYQMYLVNITFLPFKEIPLNVKWLFYFFSFLWFSYRVWGKLKHKWCWFRFSTFLFIPPWLPCSWIVIQT